jgi:hypothetical protein
MVTGSHKRLRETKLIRGNFCLELMMQRLLLDLNSTLKNSPPIKMHSRDINWSSGAELKLIKGMSLLLDYLIRNRTNLSLTTIISCLLSVIKRIQLVKLLGYSIMTFIKRVDPNISVHLQLILKIESYANYLLLRYNMILIAFQKELTLQSLFKETLMHPEKLKG